MGKVAVVYWSGTGNTEEMAKAVLEGAKKGGAEAELFTVSDFSADKMADYNGFLFGCPAMGDEVLEEDEFERKRKRSSRAFLSASLARTVGALALGWRLGRSARKLPAPSSSPTA